MLVIQFIFKNNKTLLGTFYGYFDEEYGDLPIPPLPLRSPPIIKGRADPRIAESKKGFGFDVLN